jgi:uncharacterized membrane protein YtjA (UPF0391 family)
MNPPQKKIPSLFSIKTSGMPNTTCKRKTRFQVSAFVSAGFPQGNIGQATITAKRQSAKEVIPMLKWPLVFLVLALIAGVFGFFGIMSAAAGIAKVLFFIFLVIFVLSFFMGRGSNKTSV